MRSCSAFSLKKKKKRKPPVTFSEELHVGLILEIETFICFWLLTLCLSAPYSRAQKGKAAMIICDLPSQASDARDAKQMRMGLGFSDEKSCMKRGSGKRPLAAVETLISKVSTYRVMKAANEHVLSAPRRNCQIGQCQGLVSRGSAPCLHS